MRIMCLGKASVCSLKTHSFPYSIFFKGVGVALTLQAKGDNLLALMLTVISNMLGIVTIPYLLSVYLAEATIKISPNDLVLRLIYTVLIPSICGIAARRYSSAVSAFMVKHKAIMGMFSNSNLICIVWMALSKSRSVIIHQSGGEIVCIVITVVTQHCFYLAYNYILLRQLGIFPLKQMIAVLIMASQKSSPVALAVISNIASNDDEKGLLTIPCVIGQLAQIFIGSFVANWFAAMVDDHERNVAEAEAKKNNAELSTYGAINDVELVVQTNINGSKNTPERI
jgi:sodium/bile acid cotransporter 7